MKTILMEKVLRVIRNKKQLERTLEVKITNRGKEVTISGDADDEYLGQKVLEAIEMGFPISHALLIKEEGLMFEVLNIRDYTKRTDLERIRGRIIGKDGRAIRTLANLTKSFMEVKDNFVGIIAHPETMEIAQEAVISIVKGSKHSNVYAHLEKNQPEEVSDLGIRE